jgi:oligopeptide transport system substrate-binding protein
MKIFHAFRVFSRHFFLLPLLTLCTVLLNSCNLSELNNPYPDHQKQQRILYSAFSEQPKHLDPAIAYSSDEYKFIAQIYEPPFQYHYLKRPYQLIPLTAKKMPTVIYLDAQQQPLATPIDDKNIVYTDYIIDIQAGIKYQPHPALATDATGKFLYHHLSEADLAKINTLSDFPHTGTRELIAEDYVYQIKRLANPKNQSPIAEMMKQYIVGFAELSHQLSTQPAMKLTDTPINGVVALNRYQYRIRIKGKYPQFKYWLAMPFFAPMPWEADLFYAQAGLKNKNITLDWFPIGTGAYLLSENNPNKRMVLSKNPNFHFETYPTEGEESDKKLGLLKDAGKKLPFIDAEIYSLEKESIPYWNKFLQGYYDASGIASDSFDQAVQISGAGNALLTPAMQEKGIQLETSVTTSIHYLGFNMLDNVVGGHSEAARKLRLAISIAIDYEEYIAIFLNGRAVAAQGILPPGIYGADEKQFNPYLYDANGHRKSIQIARQLLAQAGYTNGINPKTKEALTLYFDTTSVSIDDRAMMNWYRKQFEKLGINLVVRSSDYNRFQEKVRTGNAQLFLWGWNADYPDPENFFFLLYGGNAKVKYGGENAVNYQNKQFDSLFNQMRNSDDSPQRYQIIQQMQEQVRHDAPWVFGFHPKNFVLSHHWYQNLKPNLMANNRLKYTRINPTERLEKRQAWNKAILWPFILIIVVFLLSLLPVLRAYQQRLHTTLK